MLIGWVWRSRSQWEVEVGVLWSQHKITFISLKILDATTGLLKKKKKVKKEWKKDKYLLQNNRLTDISDEWSWEAPAKIKIKKRKVMGQPHNGLRDLDSPQPTETMPANLTETKTENRTATVLQIKRKATTTYQNGFVLAKSWCHPSPLSSVYYYFLRRTEKDILTQGEKQQNLRGGNFNRGHAWHGDIIYSQCVRSEQIGRLLFLTVLCHHTNYRKRLESGQSKWSVTGHKEPPLLSICSRKNNMR